jgi:hypothetical protein
MASIDQILLIVVSRPLREVSPRYDFCQLLFSGCNGNLLVNEGFL